MIEYESLKNSNEKLHDKYLKISQQIIESGWFINGPHLKNFENKFANYCNTNHCAGVANGLDALIISLKILNLPKKSEVLVPSNTYIATILAILQNDLIPVLVEPDIRTYNIDPLLIEEKITNKTSAILVVHLYGKVCEMDKIVSICSKHKLKLIEDCAQSHGAKFKNQKSGTFGDLGAFSFYPTKNLGALGDAGAITTHSNELYEKAITYRNYGSKIKYQNDMIGVNSRLDELQAGFLSVKLEILDDINDHKRKLANLYHSELSNNFIKPLKNPDFFDVFHIYNIRHPKRDEIREYLLKKEIMTEIHYPISPSKQLAMKGVIDECNYPISEEIHRTTLSLPISYGHTADDILQVVKALNDF